jgi:ATP-binding cassette subfamily B protein
VQSINEGLGGIRDVLLDQTQSVFARRFNQIDWPLRQAQASNSIIGPSPRFAVEALGMVLIALLGYYMTASGGGIAVAIPTLGALALGAQRLMPLLQQTYQGWAYVAGNRQVLIDVVVLLQQAVAREMQALVAPLPFERDIRLEKVSFRYQPELPLVLHQLDLSISKGARVGFIGITGSGKSTALDLLMGLLQPSTGQILVDSIPIISTARLAWQRNVAHVPQAIFLADASFAENIAFGVPAEQIDLVRVRQAAQQAQINQFIESSPQGYEAIVGERGVRLSGGQRQRIGIARALYKQAKVLVFDEATSALDSETEGAVMKAIEGLSDDLTIFIIAHRLSTLKNCTQIVELVDGGIKRIGTYKKVAAPTAEPNCKVKI